MWCSLRLCVTSRISRWQLLSFAAPALPLAVLTLPFYIFLPAFYAQTLGLATVGGILLLARFFDMASDLAMGAISDITQKYGRKIWLAFGTPLCALAAWQIFVPPATPTAAYLLLWSLLLYAGWTIIAVPYSAMAAEWSADTHERTRIVAYREAATAIGTLLCLLLPVLLVIEAQAQQMRLFGALVAVGVPCAMLLLLTQIHEKPAVINHSNTTKLQYWHLLKHHSPFRQLLLAYLLNGLANGLPASLFSVFVVSWLGVSDLAQQGLMLVVYFLAGLGGIPLWQFLSKKYGKQRVWCSAMLLACAFFLLTPLSNAEALWVYWLMVVGTGLCLGADVILPASLQADVIAQDTNRTGHSKAGLLMGAWSMATKLALALAVGIAFPLLDWAGLKTGTTATDLPAFMLISLYALLPTILKLCAVKLMWRTCPKL